MPRPHDPFTDAPLRANNSHATSGTTSSHLRNQASQSSLRSNASTAPTGTRQQRDNLFAHALSRRPTSRTTPRIEDGVVLADPDSDDELAAVQQRQRHGRRGSPETKNIRLRPRQQEEDQHEQQDIVNRQPDGNYIASLLGENSHGSLPTVMTAELEMEEKQKRLDAQFVEMARQLFTTGSTVGAGGRGGRGSKKMEEELEFDAIPLQNRLRVQVMQKVEEERWMFEASEQFHRTHYWGSIE